jgi:AcrR family transcriptional regulator
MVSQPAVRPASRDRILEAAAREFAARGFDGATVDRIARRAGVNKAMLYYHFRSKADLYRTILRALFHDVARAVEGVRDAGGPADRQVERFAAAVAAQAVARPHFPGIWLRELADGGRQLDARIVGELRRVIVVLAGMLQDGRRQGIFRDAPPFLTHLTIVAPLLLFTASAPIRTRFARAFPQRSGHAPPADALRFVQDVTLAALRRDAGRRPNRSRREGTQVGQEPRRPPSPTPRSKQPC